jgi:hypothetical protein
MTTFSVLIVDIAQNLFTEFSKKSQKLQERIPSSDGWLVMATNNSLVSQFPADSLQ